MSKRILRAGVALIVGALVFVSTGAPGCPNCFG
jgi:hypothetical protein